MRVDQNGNPDVCRVSYTPVAEATRKMGDDLKLTMNSVIHDLSRMSHMNPDPQVKRLLAIAITNLELGAVMAIKAYFSEGFVYERPQQNPSQASAK